MPVCGAAMAKSEARVTVLGVPDRPGAALSIFSKVAAKNIALDMIVQNEAADGCADISFTVLRDDLPATLRAVDEAVKELGAEGSTCDENVSKISVVGLGMATQPGVAGTMFRALAEKGINIQMISTSEIKISALVAREHAQEALRAVHAAFQLHVPPPDGKGRQDAAASRRPKPDAAALLARLQRMEKLVIEGIDLDESQSRVTFVGLPDMPGLAAQTFDELADRGHRRRHDRAERRPGETGEYLGHGAARRPPEDDCRGRRPGQNARLCRAHPLREGGQALRVRRGHQEPHRSGRADVPIAGRGGRQYRAD